MGQLYIPGKRDVKGPWLLSVSELESLDQVLDSIEKKLAESAEKQIIDEAQADVDKGDFPKLFPDLKTALELKREQYARPSMSFYKKAKAVTVKSTDDKVLTDTSIKDVIRDSRLKDFTPGNLQIEIKNIGNKFIFDVGRNRFDGKLSYDVDCYDQRCKDDIVFDIDSWIDKHKPSKPRQIWSSMWFLFMMLGFVCSAWLLPYIITTESYDYKPAYKKELDGLLTTGITKENQAKAIELFIKYNVDYLPENVRDKQAVKIDYQWLRVAVVLLLIAIASIFRPETTIGIGRHKWLVERYNKYIKFVFVTIPGSIILPPLFLFIRKLLGM